MLVHTNWAGRYSALRAAARAGDADEASCPQVYFRAGRERFIPIRAALHEDMRSISRHDSRDMIERSTLYICHIESDDLPYVGNHHFYLNVRESPI